MTDTHNWNQIHKLLLDKLGYRQIISSLHNDMISYASPSGKKILIKKSNVMSVEYVQSICLHVGYDYIAFVKFYSK